MHKRFETPLFNSKQAKLKTDRTKCQQRCTQAL